MPTAIEPGPGSPSGTPAAAPGASAGGGLADAGQTLAQAAGWTRVLAELDARRAAAFAAGDVSLLHAVDSPGSPAWERDRLAIAGLAGRDVRVRDVRVDILAVRERQRSAQAVVLIVTDRRGAYEVVDALTSAVVERHPAAPRRTWRVVLVPAGGAWRVHDVRIASPSAG